MKNKTKETAEQGLACAVKKVLSLLLSIAMLFSITAGIDLSAYAARNGDFYYGLLDDGTVEINGYAGSNTNITIPSKINGYNVSQIGAYAFSGEEAFQNVTISNGVTKISRYAFNGCSGLKKVILPNSLITIGLDAFSECTNLSSINFPDGLKIIQGDAFYCCENLTGVTIPSSVEIIGGYSFYGCTNLKNVNLNEGLKWIYQDAFRFCSALESIILPKGLKIVGEGAFADCTSLKSVIIPTEATEYGYNVFSGCTSLTNAYVGQLGSYMFKDCINLNDITIPDSITEVTNEFEDTAYYNDKTNWVNGVLYIENHLIKANEDIEGKYTIKDGTVSIASGAFADCTKLTDVRIPDSVVSIGGYAFRGCSQLKDINIPDRAISIGREAFDDTEWSYLSAWDGNVKYIGNHLLKVYKYISGEYAVKSGTVSIADGAFQNCTELTGISIPSSVELIKNGAFSGCSELTNIIVDKKNKVYDSRDNCNAIIETKTNSLIAGCKNSKISSSVTNIGKNAFFFCNGLEKICIPNGVTSIESGAFYVNANAYPIEITIPKSVNWIGESILPYGSTIYGYSNSYAETYCDGNGYKFIALDKLQVPNVKLTVNPNETFTISWDKVENADKYEVYCYDGNNWDYNLYKTTTGTSVITDIVSSGVTYYYTVKAIDSKNNYFPSLSKFVTGVNEEHTHTWDAGKVTKAATCTANGVKTYTCTKCKATKTEAIKATGHSYDAGKVTKAATATTAGVKTYTCTKCNATKTETIKATGLKTPVLKAAVNANGTIKLSWGKVAEAEKYELYIRQADGSYKLMKTTNATSFTTAFATYGKQFTYKMCAVTGNTKSAYSAVVNATNTKKLQTPTMKAAVNANGTFKLSWSAVTGATSYQLYIKQADGSYKLMKTTNATSFTTAFATYGKQFTYKMRAVTSKNSSATSAYSAAVNATNTKKLQTPTMKATVNANGTFKLSWNKVAGADKYELYIKQADGSYKLMKTTNATSFTTAFATYGKQFTYKMRAVTSKNSSATSAYSSAVNAKNTKKLQTPSLKVAVNKNGSFKLSWGKVTGATSYQIYMKQSNGSYKLIKTTSSTSFTTAVATKGKTYSYKVRAITSKNKNATSNYSSVVNAKRK